MNIAIIDDLISETDLLFNTLTEYSASAGNSFCIERFESGEDFLSGYQPYRYSVIFLDIYMKGMSGIEAAVSVRKTDPEVLIVFMTSSSDHMREAFDIHAYQYLIKTEDDEKLRQSVIRLMDDIMKKQGAYVPVLSITSEKTNFSIPYSDIVYVKSSNHNVEIMDSRHNIYCPRVTYTVIRGKLSSDSRFLQINRGILVNMDKIRSFAPPTCELEGGISFPVNIREKRLINEIRQNYIFSKMHSEMNTGSGSL
ncbi:MAG: LytTR family DNA-binding domain-containing protein [Lachnospiraceae bacterium]|nr:LytTR family DNA-binding domain-containing protein [Lachnospiraceae bacterium]